MVNEALRAVAGASHPLAGRAKHEDAPSNSGPKNADVKTADPATVRET